MITTTPSQDVIRRREDTLCKFIREYIFKVTQVVTAARRVSTTSSRHRSHADANGCSAHDANSLSRSWNDLNAPYSQWFRIEMSDSHNMQRFVEDECVGNWSPRHTHFELTIDISLVAEPLSEHVLLERWKIKFKREHRSSLSNASDELLTPSLLYKRMSIQIRSILSYLRLLPTHCIVQSWEQSLAEQSMMIHRQTNKTDTKLAPPANASAAAIPFALYHLIYSQHNRQSDNISNFAGESKSFSFAPLLSSFGKIRTTVFYAANTHRDFAWLIPSVPGKNPPLEDDNLSQHIDSRSRYWDKRDDTTHNHQHSQHTPPSHSNNHALSSSSSSASESHPQPQTSTKQPATLPAFDNHASPNLEVKVMDDQVMINNLTNSHKHRSSASPPIKSLNTTMLAFHESPVLHTSTPKLDPMREMEKIRLSTIFGAAPPVISLADVSNVGAGTNDSSTGSHTMSGSQLLDSIVREKQILSSRKRVSIMKTLNDDVLFGDCEEDKDTDSDSDGKDDGKEEDDMVCGDSDHQDIQDEIFETYQDEDEHDLKQKCIAEMSHLIQMCCQVDKGVSLESFNKKDKLLEGVDGSAGSGSGGEKYFEIVSKHFEVRKQRLVHMKKTSTSVLSKSSNSTS